MSNVPARLLREYRILVNDMGGAPVVGIGLVAFRFIEIRRLYFFGRRLARRVPLGNIWSHIINFARGGLRRGAEGLIRSPPARETFFGRSRGGPPFWLSGARAAKGGGL